MTNEAAKASQSPLEQSKDDSASVYVTPSGRTVNYTAAHKAFLDQTRGKFSNPAGISDYVSRASTLVSGSYESINSESKETVRDKKARMSLWAYAHRFGYACAFLDILRQTGIRPRFKRMLDIGCGYGVQPAVLRGLGVAEEAYGIDIVDRVSLLDSKLLKKLHRRMRLLRFLEPYIDRLESKNPETLTPFQKTVLGKMMTPMQSVYRSGGFRLSPDIYNLKMRREAKLDGFWEDDIYKHTGKYDLITAFSSVEWFDSKKLFAKVSELLEENGVFFMYVASWWGANAAIRANTYFPYALQRLNGEDREAYIEKFHEGEASEVRNLYGYFDPQHPTFSDYAKFAYENDLMPVGYRFCGPPSKYSQKGGIHPLGYALDDTARFREALDDIHQFRPDVNSLDLLSSMQYFIFVKTDRNKRADARKYDAVQKDTDIQYRPDGIIGKLVRALGIRFLLKK